MAGDVATGDEPATTLGDLAPMRVGDASAV